MLQRTTEHAIISLRPNLIDAFLAGEKCVELRRRAPKLVAGTLIWFYGKIPCGKVMAVGKLQCIAITPTDEIWRNYRKCIGIGKAEFDEYLGDLDEAAVLSFETIARITTPVGLSDLRQIESRFQPPQFFRMVRGGALLDRLMQSQPSEFRPVCSHQ